MYYESDVLVSEACIGMFTQKRVAAEALYRQTSTAVSLAARSMNIPVKVLFYTLQERILSH